MTSNNSQKGFAQNQTMQGFAMPISIAIIVLVLIGGVTLYFVMRKPSVDHGVIKKDEAMMEKKETVATPEEVMNKDGAVMEKKEETMMEKTSGVEAVDNKEAGATMEHKNQIEAMTYQYSGQLKNVANGKTILGVKFEDNSSGIVQSNFKDDIYNLKATFNGLPDPKGSDFYEGWLVRKGLYFSVISTGKAKKVNGVYTNEYSSKTNLVGHSFYVLTLEPDDNNSSPADHVLEGTITKN